MAELGIIASGISIASIAIQTADSVLKLKTFWDSVKEASEDVAYLIEEIEVLGLVLAGIADGNTQNGESPVEIESTAAARCLELCKRGADTLRKLVEDLASEIGRRKKWGGVKTTLKRNTVERLRERLRSAQTMMLLAEQTYAKALQKRYHDLQRQWAEVQQRRLADIETTISRNTPASSHRTSITHSPQSKFANDTCNTRADLKNELDTVQRSHRQVSRVLHKQQLFKARLQTPSWLFAQGRAWELCGFLARSEWNLSFHTYNILYDDNSPVIEFARLGDISSMQRLFSERKATPFDRTHYGMTVLDTAAVYGNPDICRLLLNKGADPNDSAIGSSLNCACRSAIAFSRGDEEKFFQTLMILESASDAEIFDNWRNFDFRGPTESFRWLLQKQSLHEKVANLEDLLEIVFRLSKWYKPNLPSLVRLALGSQPINSEVCNALDAFDRNLLVLVSESLGRYRLGHNYFSFSRRSKTLASPNGKHLLNNMFRYSPEIDEYISLLKELVLGGSDLHYFAPDVFDDSGTPLIALLKGCVEGSQAQFPSVHSTSDLVPLKLWLELLQGLGIDLAEYGRTEHELFVRSHYSAYGFCKRYERHQQPYEDLVLVYSLHLVSFCYGPEVEDWRVWFGWEDEWEEFFVEFWGMIEHPERAMPGAWNEFEAAYD